MKWVLGGGGGEGLGGTFLSPMHLGMRTPLWFLGGSSPCPGPGRVLPAEALRCDRLLLDGEGRRVPTNRRAPGFCAGGAQRAGPQPGLGEGVLVLPGPGPGSLGPPGHLASPPRGRGQGIGQGLWTRAWVRATFGSGVERWVDVGGGKGRWGPLAWNGNTPGGGGWWVRSEPPSGHVRESGS